LFFFSCGLVPPSCVSPDACEWTPYLAQHGGFFFWKIKIFSLKIFPFIKRVFFKECFFLKNQALSPENKRPYYQVRTKGIYVVLDTLESVFSEKRSLSWDKATELSQVERSPTCIGADPGSCPKERTNYKAKRKKNLIITLCFISARRFASTRKHTVTNLSTGELTPRMGRAAHRPLRVLSTLNISEWMITLTVLTQPCG